MPCLPELYYSAEILFRNWLCLTVFDWCGSLDTVVSMGMRRPTHLQERDQVLLLWGRSIVFRITFECQAEGAGVVTYITLHLMELGDCLSPVENVAEKAQTRLDEILIEAA
jgi:hypothetical protein